MTLTIRPAIPADADKVAPLIYSAAPQKYDYWFGCFGHEPLAVIADAFRAGAGVMGYQHYWVAEQNGEVLGGGSFYSAREIKDAKQQLLVWALPYFGVFKLPKLIKRGLELSALQQPFYDDMLYVGNLGVYPKAQGNGVATALLAYHEKTARENGLKYGLDVAVTNTRAIALYRHLGFEKTFKNTFSGEQSAQIPDSWRMLLNQQTPQGSSMSNRDINIRKATAADAAIVAPLMYSAGTEVYDYWFGSTGQATIDIIADAFVNNVSIMGYGCHWVAEKNNDVMGVGAFYSGWFAQKTLLSLLAWMLSFFGRKAVGVVTRGMKIAKTSPIPSRLMYVANFGVSPAAQGQGVGTALLHFHIARAKKHAMIHQFGLDVAETNPNAQRLYERMGMQQRSERSIKGVDASVVPRVRRMMMGV